MFEKNRHGSTGNVRIRFESKYTKFSDLDYTDMQSDISITPNTGFDTFDSKMNHYSSEPSPDENIGDELPTKRSNLQLYKSFSS